MSQTDENNRLTTQDLIDYLAEKEIEVERKTIFADIATLKDFGLDIDVSKSKDNGGYCVLTRDFELAEIKLITEAILSSRFISVKKSKDLIDKLSTLVGPSERKELKREVFVQGRVKTENESVYYNVDAIHNAMLNNNEITFTYLDWNKDKELVPRRNGKLYRVSPWALTIKDENYYLIAFDDKADSIKHYRVDKIKDIKSINRSSRLGKNTFMEYNVGEYTNQNFGMFSGEEDIVTLVVPELKVGIILDRFGKDIDIRTLEDGRVSMRVPVLISQQFYGWITGIGLDVEISSPQYVREEYREYLKRIIKLYK